MKTYNTLNDLLNSFPTGPPDGITFEIQSAYMKAWPYIHGFHNESGKNWTLYPKIMAATSGGWDSDIVVDLIERIGYPQSEVRYVFYETGMEFEATRRHLAYLEKRYGIQIERVRAAIPVPLGVRKYGIPFLSKRAVITPEDFSGTASNGRTRPCRNCCGSIPAVNPPSAGGAASGGKEAR